MTRSSATQTGMPCSEAARVAKGALLRLGYHPEVTTAPQAGVPGQVIGRKNSGWSMANPEPGDDYTATVTITCSNQGAHFEAETDEPIPASLTFKSDFASAVDRMANRRRETRPRVAERPEAGLVISIEPLRGSEAAAEFGYDLSASGITPVRVKIDNRSDRTYAFSADAVQLVTQEGARAQPLTDASTDKLAGSLQPTVRKKRIPDATLAPKDVLTGFVYFPVSTYRRATVVLIDQETEEPEGFSVEF
jgi:hypothetical protein